jgi:hypothetical protein
MRKRGCREEFEHGLPAADTVRFPRTIGNSPRGRGCQRGVHGFQSGGASLPIRSLRLGLTWIQRIANTSILPAVLAPSVGPSNIRCQTRTRKRAAALSWADRAGRGEAGTAQRQLVRALDVTGPITAPESTQGFSRTHACWDGTSPTNAVNWRAPVAGEAPPRRRNPGSRAASRDCSSQWRPPGARHRRRAR